MIPHGVLEHLAADGPEAAATRRASAVRDGAARGPVLRADAPLQGHRRCCSSAWATGIDGARAVDRGHAADGHLARLRRRRAPAGACASCARFIGRRRAAGVLPCALTSSCCPTARSISRACCSRRSAFGKPLLLSDVGGFPEIAATGAARSCSRRRRRARCTSALRELLGDAPRDAMARMAAPQRPELAARSQLSACER